MKCRTCPNIITNPAHARIGVCANCVARSSRRNFKTLRSPSYTFGTQAPKSDGFPKAD